MQKRAKRGFALLLILAMLLGLTACNSGGNETGDNGADTDKIVIGLTGNLTGYDPASGNQEYYGRPEMDA